MSEKEIVKQGMALAENERREKQVKVVKEIALKTLERIDTLEKEKKELESQIKVLKLDIDDLKEGRLDRIAERQEKDESAKKVSVVIIIKEKEVIRETAPWYWPYNIIWNYPPAWRPATPVVTYGGSGNAIPCNVGGINATLTTNAVDSVDFEPAAFYTVTGAVARDAAIGTYDVNGHIVHLR